MSGLDRYLCIINLFDEAKPDWTIPEIAFSLDVPTSSIYRTVRELVAAEMLEQSTEAHYRLGAAFIEFERRVRRTDPLIRLSDGPLDDVADQTQLPCNVVLARLYGNKVMCVADARSGSENIRTSYERGRPQPLLRGATSKMILAQLPTRRLDRLLANSEVAGMGQTLLDLRKELVMARRGGYIITRGEVDPGLVGIAAPISNLGSGIAASLSIIVQKSRLTEIVEHRLVLLVTMSANLMSDRVGNPGRSQTDATMDA